MASQVTLTGGAFQDPHGNPVALGNLVLTLSQDGLVTGTGQIAPITVVFPLDSSGNLVSSPTPSVWGNDNITPTGTFYTAEVLNAGGSRVWGPEIWTLTGAGPINVGTIPPTTKSGGITVNLPTLQTNGSNNASQSLLNLAAGTNITIVNSGGTDTISATGGASFSTSGQGGFYGPGILKIPGSGFNSTSQLNNANNEVRVFQFSMEYNVTITKCNYYAATGSNGTKFSFGIYSANGNTKIVDSGVMTVASPPALFSTTFSAVTLNQGTTYYLAQTASTATGITGQAESINANLLIQMNQNANRAGTAANASAAGVLPSTLGVITVDNVNPFAAVPFFEP